MARPRILDDAKRKMVSVPGALAKAIENYRFKNRLKTEAEAIRQLIELGLGKAPASTPPGSSTPGNTRNPATTSATKVRPRSSAPKAKALAMSKLEQIRALREQGAG